MIGRNRPHWPVLGSRLAVLLWLTAGHAATPDVPAAAPPPDAHVAVLGADQVVKILDETVDWYRTLGVQQQNASEPSDLLILFANRQTADKVVALAFDIARANAELLSSEASARPEDEGPGSPQALARRQQALDGERQSLEAEIEAERRRGGAKAADKVDELRSELAMVAARRNLLDTMAEFVDRSDPKGAGANALKAQIDAIAATVPPSNLPSSAAPAIASTTPAPAAAAASTVMPSAATKTGPPASTSSGIWDLGDNVLKLKAKLASIKAIDGRTAGLAKTLEDISTAPVDQLKTYAMRSDALAAAADHAAGDALKALRSQFDTLAWLFKQTSAIVIPLAEEQVLLRQYRHNLATWRAATDKQYQGALNRLGIRLGVLLGLLAVVFLIGEVWRRAVLRYAHEPRRRYQLLLIRKIALWTLVVAIVGLSFVTEISTFATFAGLLTAGLAVAMQSVLVSVVGYFFLIGKYGIRVGDRIQIGTVVGEVIDLGLVRMHLMELNANGPLGPTGRVVAFANLIVFQASGGLFKQIPGVNLTWHETVVTLPAVADYAALKLELMTAVGRVVGEYHDEIVRQTEEIQKTTAAGNLSAAVPQVQMHIVSGHMDAQIGYPVSVQHSVEIDERVAEAVLEVIAAADPRRGAR